MKEYLSGNFISHKCHSPVATNSLLLLLDISRHTFHELGSDLIVVRQTSGYFAQQVPKQGEHLHPLLQAGPLQLPLGHLGVGGLLGGEGDEGVPGLGEAVRLVVDVAAVPRQQLRRAGLARAWAASKPEDSACNRQLIRS